jgi:IclR family KDG regulon transcriptional repressor
MAKASKRRPAAPASARNGNGNVVPMLMKAFDLLEAFREHPNGLTHAELEKLYPNVSRVSIFRILRSLESLSYLDKSEETGRFALGPKFVQLGQLAERRLELVDLAKPHMQEMLERFNENVNLGKLQNFELIYLKILESSQPLRVGVLPNRRNAIYCSATGKAILAHMGEDSVDEYLRLTKLSAFTKNTITTHDGFRRELEKVRKQGFAVDDQENVEGVRCIGIPLFDEGGHPIASMSFTGPSARMTDAKFKLLLDALRKARDRMTVRRRSLSRA